MAERWGIMTEKGRLPKIVRLLETDTPAFVSGYGNQVVVEVRRVPAGYGSNKGMRKLREIFTDANSQTGH